jgi:hypothetical protein
MNLETSTVNVLLAGVIALQGWIIREQQNLRAKVERVLGEHAIMKDEIVRLSKMAKLVPLAFLPLLIGCGAIFTRQDTVHRQVVGVPAGTNQVQYVTNEVFAVGKSTVTNWLTNVIQVVSPGYSVTNTWTNVLYTVNPKVDTALGVAQSVSSVVPSPISGAVTGGLALLSAGLAFWARMKSQRAGLLDTVIQGVEEANDPKVKASIKAIARASGVEARLQGEVKRVTE